MVAPMRIRPAQFRGVAEMIRKDEFWSLDATDAQIILAALDRCACDHPKREREQMKLLRSIHAKLEAV